MSVDENLSRDNIHIKPYQLSLGAQLLSLFISIYKRKITIKKMILYSLK